MTSNDPIGTKLSQYAGPDHGPFACHNCVHYRWPHLCDHPKVIEDAKAGSLKMNRNGLAVIAPGGCCKYFRN